jgi:hypothetical protein
MKPFSRDGEEFNPGNLRKAMDDPILQSEKKARLLEHFYKIEFDHLLPLLTSCNFLNLYKSKELLKSYKGIDKRQTSDFVEMSNTEIPSSKIGEQKYTNHSRHEIKI